MNFFKLSAIAATLVMGSAFANPILVGTELHNDKCDVTVVKKVVKATVFRPMGGSCYREISLNAERVSELLKAKGYKPTVVETANDVKEGLVVFGGINGTYLPTAGYDDCLIHINKYMLTVGFGTGAKETTVNTYSYNTLITAEIFDIAG